MKRPPEYFWLPRSRQSNGECYHAKRCGAHVLEAVPRNDALSRILNERLRPCGNCVESHGLEPVFENVL